MRAGSKFVTALLLVALSVAARTAERPHIQFAEKVSLATGASQMQFDAYGRRFVLNLQANDRVSFPGYHLWRGTLADSPGSWVRLTEHAGTTEGVIWDGRDLYSVTRYDKVAAYLGTPLTSKASDPVIFRLSDSTNLLPSGYCATEPSTDGLASNNGLVQYRNMVAELQAQALAGATKQIEISMIADSAMSTGNSEDPITVMLNSYNIVDGIYSEQVGLLIVPSDVRKIPAAGDPFTSTAASALLDQLSTYRKDTPAVAALGIAHLFTGHDLDGDTVGIARINGACKSDEGVSLSEGLHGFWSSALIMAHEIGHNLGAEHDGSGSCAAMPNYYIMAPVLNFSEQFSQCSLTAINAFVASAPASCITSAVYAHVELPRNNATVWGEVGLPLVVPVELLSTGTQPINDVKLDLPLHPSLVFTSSTPGVNCTPTSTGLSCNVGTIPANTTRTVELTFLPGMEGGFSNDITVSASNNQNNRHSTQTFGIYVLPNVDMSVSAATSTTTAIVGDDVDVTLTLKSLKSHAAQNVRVGVYGAGLQGVSVDAPPGVTCEFDVNFSGQTFCIVGDIPAYTTRTIVVHSKAVQVGSSMQGTVYASADNDPTRDNNTVYIKMDSIVAAHDVGLEDLTTSAPVRINMPYEYKANLRSDGVQSVSGVRVNVNLYMQDRSSLDAVSSVTVGGSSCTKLSANQYDCVVGTMAAGEVLPFSIKGIATTLGETSVWLRARADINDNTYNDEINRGWIVRYGLDASVSLGTSQLLIVQGQESSGSFAAWSNGTQAASNAVMNVELPPQVHFTRFFARDSTTTSCTLVDPQHLRCVYNIPPASSYYDVTYYVVGDVSGVYQASASIVLPGDENPANDKVQWPIAVSAVIDAGVRSSFVFPKYLVTGHDATVPVTVFTGSQPVINAVASVSASGGSEVVSATSGSGSCNRVDAHQYSCALGNLAANSTVTVTATIAASPPGGTLGVFGASVSAPGDNIPNNNQISSVFNVATAGDVRVTVASTTVSAKASESFSLPSITIWRKGDVAEGKLLITLPAGVTIESMSGSVYACSGTTQLQCDLPSSWPEDQGLQVDLKLSTGVATNFTVTAKVTAFNDSTSSNDEASIGVSVSGAPNPPATGGGGASGGGGSSSGGGGGGGGGGRLEWPIALFLGLMLVRRLRAERSRDPARRRIRTSP